MEIVDRFRTGDARRPTAERREAIRWQGEPNWWMSSVNVRLGADRYQPNEGVVAAPATGTSGHYRLDASCSWPPRMVGVLVSLVSARLRGEVMDAASHPNRNAGISRSRAGL